MAAWLWRSFTVTSVTTVQSTASALTVTVRRAHGPVSSAYGCAGHWALSRWLGSSVRSGRLFHPLAVVPTGRWLVPEYLAPGVYVEETTSRSRSIEGVPTGTLGMVGPTEFGPVPHPSAPPGMAYAPVLLTSTAEYERVFGGTTIDARPCRLALAAGAFFANGGQRLYVQRVFVPTPVGASAGPDDDIAGVDLPVGNDPVVRWEARWPGAAGSRIRVVTRVRRGENVQTGTQLSGVLPGAVVEIATVVDGHPPVLADDVVPANLHVVTLVDGVLHLRDGAGDIAAPVEGHAAFHVTVDVEVHFGDRIDHYQRLELGDEHPRSISQVLNATEPGGDSRLVWLVDAQPAGATNAAPTPDVLLAALVSPGELGVHLAGGSDGDELTPQALQGQEAPAKSSSPATGLAALAEVDEIAVVAMPDSTSFEDAGRAAQAVDALIAHCERARFRFALLDPPENATASEVRAFRSSFDNSYAALYYPWVRVSTLTAGADGGSTPITIGVPPSGAVAGVYARSDIERGVHTAPANQVLRGITELVASMSDTDQDVLNPEGVNALRSFPGQGIRVWGARTISSDPEWRYVPIRRLAIYLEHSIERSTQWAVFEPNDERLWTSIRSTVEDFLTSVWRSGALPGSKPQEAFFVRCDRTTMSQSDLDNGRLVCLVGFAPASPAEFTVFRISHLTADRRDD